MVTRSTLGSWLFVNLCTRSKASFSKAPLALLYLNNKPFGGVMDSHRVLVVEDSSGIRTGIRKSLESLNLEIIEATNGREGLNFALNGNFDLIITDIEMPLINGVEFCRQLKGTPATRSIPVIMLTPLDSEADVHRGFEAGATVSISKDEAHKCLCEEVAKTLSKFALHRQQLILVVDDSSTIRRLVEEGLAQAGFQVVTAENGKKALTLINKKRPDLILSDIDMPEMNGFAFCEAVHSDPGLASIPFVTMSTHSDRGHMQRMLKQGAEAFISKPFNKDELVILIEKLLSDHFLLLLKEKQLLDSEQNLMLASITSLVSALEARDSYTRGHSESVADMLSGMAVLMGAGKDVAQRLSMGGRLHDVGKIGIRDNVLLKPGRLTDEEFAHIMQHPLIGANILKPIASLSDIVSVVQYHHERIDGKGYPEGLKGQNIPEWARMTAVADTYNALTSDRPYRKGLPREKALQIIEDERGTQLCEDCVPLFLSWISSNENV